MGKADRERIWFSYGAAQVVGTLSVEGNCIDVV
jgi:hypothetical protein